MSTRFSLFLPLSLGAVAGLPVAAHAASSPPPNIVFLFSYDQTACAIGYENPEVITPHLDQLALGTPDTALQVLPVKLTTEQVRNSPGIDTPKPASRQREMELRQHYGWPPYWGAVFADGGLAGPLV